MCDGAPSAASCVPGGVDHARVPRRGGRASWWARRGGTTALRGTSVPFITTSHRHGEGGTRASPGTATVDRPREDHGSARAPRARTPRRAGDGPDPRAPRGRHVLHLPCALARSRRRSVLPHVRLCHLRRANPTMPPLPRPRGAHPAHLRVRESRKGGHEGRLGVPDDEFAPKASHAPARADQCTPRHGERSGGNREDGKKDVFVETRSGGAAHPPPFPDRDTRRRPNSDVARSRRRIFSVTASMSCATERTGGGDGAARRGARGSTFNGVTIISRVYRSSPSKNVRNGF